MENKHYTNVEFEKETTKHFGDHEILLSFTNDLGAEAFETWWFQEGAERFNNWLKKDKYFKSEANK